MIKLEIIGNVGKDATFYSTDKGGFISFSVGATNRKGGETIWVNCTKNGSEQLAPYITKGSKVYIRGNADVSVWFDKAGQAHPQLNCNVNDVEFCGSKPDGANVQGVNVPFENQQIFQQRMKDNLFD